MGGIKGSGGSYRSGGVDGGKGKKLLLLGVVVVCLAAAGGILYMNVFGAKKPGDVVESKVDLGPADTAAPPPPGINNEGLKSPGK
jgi:hypothetical protein